MHYNFKTLVSALKKGTEICACCGRDVTNGPECMHVALSQRDSTITRYADGVKQYSFRIGEEMLLDLESLKAVPLLDHTHIRRSRDLRTINIEKELRNA